MENQTPEVQNTEATPSKTMAKWQRGLLLSVLNAISLAAVLLLPVVALIALKDSSTVAVVVAIAVFVVVLFGSRAIMYNLALRWGMSREEWFATRGWRFMFSRARRNARKSNEFWGKVNQTVSPLRPCKSCNGTGRKGRSDCPVCGGSGKVMGM